MREYVVRRLLLLIPTAFLATVIMFTLMKLVPGDVAMAIVYSNEEEASATTQAETDEQLAKIRARYGLDKPLPIQYWDWLKTVGRGEFGNSIWQYRPVRDIILERMPRTIELAMLIVFLSFAQSIPLGVIAALWRNTWMDQAVLLYSILGLSIPTIWVGTLFLFTFSRYVGWIPPIDWRGITEDPLHNLTMIGIPAFLVTFGGGAQVIRMVRSQMLEVIREDYVRTAYAKGLQHSTVVVRHALRNALLPVITQFGSYLSLALLGTVIVETLFHIPGMGKSMVDAIAQRDYPVIQGLVLVNVVIVMAINLVIDISYAWIDPRIRYA